MVERIRPAFYAVRSGRLGDWWTLLHPPYTLWHLSYSVLGATLAPQVDGTRLAGTVIAFFLAVGVGAHALDELNGRPLQTTIPARLLIGAGVVGVGGAVALGIAATPRVGTGLIPFIVVGVFLVTAYNLEWFGGRFHSDVMFAASWGAFPVLVAYFAQAQRLDWVAALAGVAAFGFSLAQRALSSPARFLRRHVHAVEGEIELLDGGVVSFNGEWLLRPLERALRAASWSFVALAAALAIGRLG